jgi:hypothetical protein
MNKDAWLKVGEFDENLFYYEVDGDLSTLWFTYVLQTHKKSELAHHELGVKSRQNFRYQQDKSFD